MKNFYNYILIIILMLTVEIFPSATYAQSPGAEVERANPSEVLKSDILVRSWVDRTALFPGDMLTYHVEVQCNNNIDILTDDLSEDELVLTGLELIASENNQSENSSGINYHFSYRLITYETSLSELKIDELRLRYYNKRQGQRIQTVAPVGEVVIPAISLVLRSTLPSELSSLALRDLAPANSISSWLGIAGTLGILLIVVVGIPAGIVIAGRLREQQADTQNNHEENVQISSTELEQIKRLDPQNNQQRRECFDQLEKLFKEFIENRTGIMASALTAKELRALFENSDSRLPVNDIVMVLEDCEQARYGKQDTLPDAIKIEHAIFLAQGLLAQQ